MTKNTQEYGGQYGYDQQQGGYGNEYQGSATSYYGSNDQPYQQYPPQGNYQGGQYPPQHPPQGNYQGQYPPQGNYQERSYPPQYDQQYPPQQPYQQQQYQGPPPGNQGYYSQPPPAGQYPPPGAHPAGGPEQDRGLMGALGGAALGGYGGHQVGHGVLGTLGGAGAGSFAEDAYKKHHKKDKKDKTHKQHKQHKKPRSRRGSSSSSSSSSSSDSDSSGKKKRRGAMAGNFHASSKDVRLERNSVLVASCHDMNGRLQHSELNLNDCLTNTNGKIFWARGGNFAASSRNIRLADRGKVLEAELGDGRGSWIHNKISLDERITNENGRLRMI